MGQSNRQVAPSLRPFAPAQGLKHSRVIARSPVYYGWIILFAAMLGLISTIPGQTVGVSIFLDKIIEELELGRSLVSLMYTVGTLAGSFALPWVGRFIDTRGPRRAVVIISFLFALACVWMGLVSGLLMLAIGFVLIRSMGQGALSLVSTHIVNIWFVRRRGLAVGLLGVGMALGMATVPVLIEALITRFEWRFAYMILGGIIALTILPLGALLYREHPERFGLRPDGRRPEQEELAEVNYTVEEARRTPIFWVFVSGVFCVAGFGTGLLFHHYDIMSNGNLDRAAAAMMFMPMGVVMATSNLISGYLMDRVRPIRLLCVLLLLLACALNLAPRVDTIELVVVYGIVVGAMLGMQGAIQGSVYAYYFGRANIGAIKGFATTIAVAGTAFGPFLFAVGLDLFGSYTPILSLSTVAPLAVALATFFIKEPSPVE